jgi:hypothetical protein
MSYRIVFPQSRYIDRIGCRRVEWRRISSGLSMTTIPGALCSSARACPTEIGRSNSTFTASACPTRLRCCNCDREACLRRTKARDRRETRVLLEGPIVPTLIRLAWPNVLVMLAQSSTGLIEMWYISRLGCVDEISTDDVFAIPLGNRA